MMKFPQKRICIFLFLSISNYIFSQNVGINTTGATPAARNLFEVLAPASFTADSSAAIYAKNSGVIAGVGYGIRVEVNGASTTNTAAYFSASGATNNYAIIVPSGRVGLGTTAPTVRLEVSGSVKVSSDLFVGVNETTGNRVIEIGTGRTGDGATAIDFITDAVTYTDYGMRLIRSSGANGQTTLYHRGTGDMLFTTQEAAAIKFQTTSTDRMTITSSGDVGIGTTAPGTKLHISGGTTVAPTLQISSDVTSNGAAFNMKDEGSNHLWHTVMRGTDHATQADQLLTIYTPDGTNFHQYMILKPDNSTNSNPGEVIMPGKLGLGSNTTLANSAIIDMTSTTQGVLVPRMTKTQRDAIASPATSLLIYVTDGSPVGFYYYTGSQWVPLVSTVTNTITSPTTIIYGGKTLMVHTSDYSGTLQWDNTAYGATGATSTTDGATNTATIVAAIGSGAQAAYYCDTLTAYGFTDWYLPAQEELLFISNTAPSFVGFPSTLGLSYWCSTEVDASNSVRVTPAKGNATVGVYVWGATLQNVLKTGALRCRCIRVQ